MRSILVSSILLVSISICNGNLNDTDLDITLCKKCSPCWNIFSKNYGPCSTDGYDLNIFNSVQPVCIDTLILLIILFLGIVTMIPTCLWICYLSIKRCRNIDGTYVVNGRTTN